MFLGEGLVEGMKGVIEDICVQSRKLTCEWGILCDFSLFTVAKYKIFISIRFTNHADWPLLLTWLSLVFEALKRMKKNPKSGFISLKMIKTCKTKINKTCTWKEKGKNISWDPSP